MALGFDTNENIREQSHKIDTTYNMIANFLLTFSHNWKQLGRCFEELCYFLTTMDRHQDKVISMNEFTRFKVYSYFLFFS